MNNRNIPTEGAIKWGYAFNQWKASFQGFSRVDEHLRAFKVNAGCGFRAVELTAGTGPWQPLGRPESIAQVYGSVEGFRQQIEACGITCVSSIFYDPGQMSYEEMHFGLSPANPQDHDGIVERARVYAAFLKDVGGDCLVVRPTQSFWKEGALDETQIRAVADCWNKAGAATAQSGVSIALHIDALSALRTMDEIEQLLTLCDPATVGLCIDTAELTIAGHDVVSLYRRFHARVRHIQFKDALATDTLDEYRERNAERALMAAGGAREIARWFGELGTGLVDFPALLLAMKELGYAGWVIIESDKGPAPIAGSIMSNSWYVQNVLLKAA